MIKNNDIYLILLISIINIIIYISIFVWVIQLEIDKCECSNDWRRTYIKVYLILYFIIIIFNSIYSIYYDIDIIYYKVFKYIIFVLNIIYIVISISYIVDLINKKCECSKGFGRELTLINSVIECIIILISFIISLTIIIYSL